MFINQFSWSSRSHFPGQYSHGGKVYTSVVQQEDVDDGSNEEDISSSHASEKQDAGELEQNDVVGGNIDDLDWLMCFVCALSLVLRYYWFNYETRTENVVW